jgi:probable HAF family extracellular repeat protein
MYKVEDITGWDLGYPDLWGINANSWVVGDVTSDGALYQALIATGPNEVQAFSGPGSANYTFLEAINDAGVAVGHWRENTLDFRPHAFMYQNNELVELDPMLGSSLSLAHDINNQGAIVGRADFTTNGDAAKMHAFLYDPSSAQPVTDLGLLPGMTAAGAVALNESNQVVGWMGHDTESQPFIYHDGNLSAIAPQGSAFDINDQGHVVGAAHGFLTTGQQSGPWLWAEREWIAIPCNGYPTAINNNDEIVGQAIFTHSNIGATYPFYYDPVPKPRSLWPGGPELPQSPTRPAQASDLVTIVEQPPHAKLLDVVHDINDSGVIPGALLRSTDFKAEGVLLIPPDQPNQQFGPTIAMIAAVMLFGRGGDAGGLSLVAGRPVPIDPWGPLTRAQKERVLQYSRAMVEQLVTDPAQREQTINEIATLLEGSSPEG